MAIAIRSLMRLSPALLLLLVLALLAPTRGHADEYNINYYLPNINYDYPNFDDPRFLGSAQLTPWGYQIEITPPPAQIFSAPAYPDEGVWERRQARRFHRGYPDWDAYYASPPWRQRDEMDFHPYWMR